ncbi:MAG: hypothetical protein PVSMB1_04950 [Gemmatimonadaceae bacterium]
MSEPELAELRYMSPKGAGHVTQGDPDFLVSLVERHPGRYHDAEIWFQGKRVAYTEQCDGRCDRKRCARWHFWGQRGPDWQHIGE